MLTEKEYTQITQYLSHQLQGEQLTAFQERLQKDTAFREEVFMEKMIRQASKYMGQQEFSRQGLAKAQELAERLEEDLFEEAAQERIASIKATYQRTYTLEELLQSFKIANAYEENLVLRNVGADPKIEVLHPAHEHPCEDNQLTFQLKNAVEIPLLLIIETNNEEEILQKNIEANTATFDIELSILPTGRYYWLLKADTPNRKLRRQYATQIGSFLINAHLNPYQ